MICKYENVFAFNYAIAPSVTLQIIVHV